MYTPLGWGHLRALSRGQGPETRVSGGGGQALLTRYLCRARSSKPGSVPPGCSAGAWSPRGKQEAQGVWGPNREAGFTSLWRVGSTLSPKNRKPGWKLQGNPPPQGSLVARAPPHLLLRGLDEQEGGLMSFTLEIKPGGKDHTCQPSVSPLCHLWPQQCGTHSI